MKNKTKLCYKCKRKRSIKLHFSRNKSKSDGLNSMCKDCAKQYQSKYMKSVRGKSIRYLYQVAYKKRVRKGKK